MLAVESELFNSINIKMRAERLELSTNSLKGYCSAIELRSHSIV